MMEIGYVTPPLGMNVFVLHGMNPQVSLKSIFGHSTRFIGADLVVLLAMSGQAGENRFQFFDAISEMGHFIEVYEPIESLKSLYERVI